MMNRSLKVLGCIGVVLALMVSPVQAASTLIGKYDNAAVYLESTPCHMPESDKLLSGKVVFKDGRAVKLCWIFDGNAVWIIDDDGNITAEDLARFKPVVTI